MKPKKLTLSAFGPYAGEQALDMELLGEHGLYAITGETGAYRFTVPDGIYARLYRLQFRGSDADTAGLSARAGF